MDLVLWGIPILLAVLILLGVALFVRRRRDREEPPSSVFPPSSGAEGGAQVRLLEGASSARQARIDALRGEVKSLRREADYAAQRGLDRRAERLRELIDEREQQLHEERPADDRAS